MQSQRFSKSICSIHFSELLPLKFIKFTQYTCEINNTPTSLSILFVQFLRGKSSQLPADVGDSGVGGSGIQQLCSLLRSEVRRGHNSVPRTGRINGLISS